MRKIVQYSLFLMLTIIGSTFAIFTLFLFAAGVLAGLFVEMVKFNSRRANSRIVVNSKLQLSKYKILEVMVEDKLNEKTEKKGKIFKLPLPEPIRNERMAYAQEK